MKSFKSLIFTLVLLASISSASYADEYHLNGNLDNITSSPDGLLIKLDSGVPTNCEGVDYNWMLVKEEHISMVSLVLTLYALEKTNITVYTKPLTEDGICEVTQVDPAD